MREPEPPALSMLGDGEGGTGKQGIAYQNEAGKGSDPLPAGFAKKVSNTKRVSSKCVSPDSSELSA
jgi:hypothetical protein